MPQVTAAKPPQSTVTVQTGTKLNLGHPKVTEVPQTVEQAAQVQASEVSAPQADPKMAALAKREMFLRDVQRRNELKEAELKAKEESLNNDNYIPKHKLIESPYQTLMDSGVAYDKVTEQALAAMGQQDPIKQLITSLQTEIADLKKGLDSDKEKAAAATTEQYQMALKQIEKQASDLVESSPEFETIKAWNAVGAVVKLIEEDFKITKVQMPIAEACKEVEETLLEHSLAMAKTNKIKAKLGEELVQAQPKPSEQKQGMKSISNSVNVNSKPMSAKERAILAFKGQL